MPATPGPRRPGRNRASLMASGCGTPPIVHRRTGSAQTFSSIPIIRIRTAAGTGSTAAASDTTTHCRLRSRISHPTFWLAALAHRQRKDTRVSSAFVSILSAQRAKNLLRRADCGRRIAVLRTDCQKDGVSCRVGVRASAIRLNASEILRKPRSG